MTSHNISGEGIDLEAIQARLRTFTELNREWLKSLGSTSLFLLLTQDVPALIAEVIRLRGAQQEETAHEDLSRTESLSQVIRMGISA